MLKDKKIIVPFSVFYEISKISNDTYYLGIFPPHDLPQRMDYIILSERSVDYGNDHLYDYFKAVSQSSSQQLVLVTENKRLEMKVYQIKTD